MAAAKQLSGTTTSAHSTEQQSAQRLEHSTGKREKYESDEDELLNHLLLTCDSDGESESDVSDDKRGEHTDMEPGEYHNETALAELR